MYINNMIPDIYIMFQFNHLMIKYYHIITFYHTIIKNVYFYGSMILFY